MPVLVGDAEEAAGPGRGTADVVDQDVDPVAGRLDQRRRAGGIGQVGQHGLHLAGPRQLVKAGGGGPGSGDHAAPARGQPADDGQADALARAGHDGGLPGQPEVHD